MICHIFRQSTERSLFAAYSNDPPLSPTPPWRLVIPFFHLDHHIPYIPAADIHSEWERVWMKNCQKRRWMAFNYSLFVDLLLLRLLRLLFVISFFQLLFFPHKCWADIYPHRNKIYLNSSTIECHLCGHRFEFPGFLPAIGMAAGGSGASAHQHDFWIGYGKAVWRCAASRAFKNLEESWNSFDTLIWQLVMNMNVLTNRGPYINGHSLYTIGATTLGCANSVPKPQLE